MSLESDIEFRDRILAEARTVWRGHRLYNELVDHCITIATGSLLDDYGQRYGMSRRGEAALKYEKPKCWWFVWYKLIEQIGVRKEQQLSCQLVRDEVFMPKGVVAKHEVAEGFADDLKTLAEIFPAPEVTDAQG